MLTCEDCGATEARRRGGEDEPARCAGCASVAAVAQGRDGAATLAAIAREIADTVPEPSREEPPAWRRALRDAAARAHGTPKSTSRPLVPAES